MHLVAEATPEQLHKAGNVGGEILNWIAMLPSVGGRRPKFVHPADGAGPRLCGLELELKPCRSMR